MKPIPNGTSVRFFRKEHDESHHAAAIESSHQLSSFDGYHYVIACKSFPYIIGFAHDEELFSDEAHAELAAKKAQIENRKVRRAELLAKIAALHAEVDALAVA